MGCDDTRIGVMTRYIFNDNTFLNNERSHVLSELGCDSAAKLRQLTIRSNKSKWHYFLPLRSGTEFVHITSKRA